VIALVAAFVALLGAFPVAADARAQAATGDLVLAGAHAVSYAAVRLHIGSKNPGIDEIYLRTLHRHYEHLCRVEGVSMVAAIAQMAHETDYLRFTGAVRAVQYNYAGLGATGGGNPGVSFPDMRTGIAAHVQHIKAYANDERLVTPLVDPRFHLVARGSAPTVGALTGTWATDPEYARKLMAHVAVLLSAEAAVAEAAVAEAEVGSGADAE
jgi:hypothetical protein